MVSTVEAGTHVTPKDLDREMLGISRQESMADVMKSQMNAMRFKFADLKARFDHAEVHSFEMKPVQRCLVL